MNLQFDYDAAITEVYGKSMSFEEVCKEIGATIF